MRFASENPASLSENIDGINHEPIELLAIDCPMDCQSAVMSLLGDRRSEMIKMDAKSGANTFIHMEFLIPSRGLFGLHARMMNATQGRAVMHHTFERYEPMRRRNTSAKSRRYDCHHYRPGYRLCP